MSDPVVPEEFSARIAEARGAPATPQRLAARRLGDAMRVVIERLVATTAPEEILATAAADLEELGERLAEYGAGRVFEGFAESANSGDPHAFFDHSPIIGRANPIAPPVHLSVDPEGVVRGPVRYGRAYEGPPGHVHGGHIAAGFDEVLGMAQSLSGAPGMTGTLTVRYRRPTPLDADLEYEGRFVRREGRKIFTEGRLLFDGQVTAEAEAIFITVDFARIAELANERHRRTDGA